MSGLRLCGIFSETVLIFDVSLVGAVPRWPFPVPQMNCNYVVFLVELSICVLFIMLRLLEKNILSRTIF